jgi:hypothetical protein
VSRRRTTPISAPALVNSSLVVSGRIPPVPNANPAMRYSGIGVIPTLAATAAISPRQRMTAPSSVSRVAVWLTL